MPRSIEPFWWSLFSAGGVVAALFLPVTMVLIGIAVPTGLIPADRMHELMHHPLARAYLFLVISLPLFHWAHRFRYAVADLGLKGLDGVLAVACYSTAILASALAALFLIPLGT